MKATEQLASNKEIKGLIALLTVSFLAFGIWNVWHQSKYRKLEYELKLKNQ